MEKNVYIRRLKRNDLKNTLRWLNDPEIKNKLSIKRTITLNSQQEWFNKIYKNSKPNNIVFAICLKSNHEHIGNVSLGLINYEDKNARLSIFIADKKNRGKGMGSSAIKLVIDYAFNELKLNKIYLKTGSNNKAAINFYRKIGFRVEGKLRKHEFINSEFVDKIIFGLLKEDYFNMG